MNERRYAVRIAPAAERDLKALSPEIRRRIKPKIDLLAYNPRPAGIEKLAGVESTYRLRVGDYRVIYTIGDRALLVLVVRVGHRREVYRGM